MLPTIMFHLLLSPLGGFWGTLKAITKHNRGDFLYEIKIKLFQTVGFGRKYNFEKNVQIKIGLTTPQFEKLEH